MKLSDKPVKLTHAALEVHFDKHTLKSLDTVNPNAESAVVLTISYFGLPLDDAQQSVLMQRVCEAAVLEVFDKGRVGVSVLNANVVLPENEKIEGDTAEEAVKSYTLADGQSAVEVLRIQSDPKNFSLKVGPVTLASDGSVAVDENVPLTDAAADFLFALSCAIGARGPIIYDPTIRYVEAKPHPFYKPIDNNGNPAPPRMTYVTAKGSEENLLKDFRFRHLDTPLSAVSRHFAAMACWIVDSQPPSADRTLALRNLWNAKNHAVIALVPDGNG